MAGLRKTKIEWADYVWNPCSGCRKVSSGCAQCYSEGIAKRFWGERKFTDVQTHPERLEQPLKTKKGGSVFVNSMSDLFHEDVSREFIAAVFGIMAACPQHKFIVLTKRPERMQLWFKLMGRDIGTFGLPQLVDEELFWPGDMVMNYNIKLDERFGYISADYDGPDLVTPHEYTWPQGEKLPYEWPLPNVILGVSVEDQKTADERIPLLLQTPAAWRMVSYEPALGPIDFTSFIDGSIRWSITTGARRIDWLVNAGESGTAKGIRPAHPDWFRSVRDQCAAAGVPYFFKGWGEWLPEASYDLRSAPRPLSGDYFPGWSPHDLRNVKRHDFEDFSRMYRVGKKKSGALLDGVEIKQFPDIMKGRL